MSFSLQFNAASVADAQAILKEEQLPDCVNQFVAQSLKGCAGSAVSVRVFGELFNKTGDPDISSVEVLVQKITFRTPKVKR